MAEKMLNKISKKSKKLNKNVKIKANLKKKTKKENKQILGKVLQANEIFKINKNFVRIKKVYGNKNKTIDTDYIFHKDVVVLGIITEISDVELKVTMPDSKTGKVKILFISETYSSYLKELLNSNEDEKELPLHLKSLNDLFVIGQSIYCRVINSKSACMDLSTIPKHIHANIKRNLITTGFTFFGSIKEINEADQDEYIVETGISNLTGKILKSDLHNTAYQISDSVLFSVTQIEHASFMSICYLNVATKTCSKILKNHNFNNIIPGNFVEFTIKEINKNDNLIKGIILDDNSISCFLLVSSLSNTIDEYNISDRINCVISAIITLKKIIYLSEISFKPNKNINKNVNDKLNVNDVVEFEVMNPNNNLGRILNTDKQCKINIIDLSRSVNINSKILCKIYNIFNNQIQITNRFEYLISNTKILTSLDNINTGDFFSGTVIQEFDKFYVVRFFNHISGTITKSETKDLYIGKIDLFEIKDITKNSDKVKLFLSQPEINYTDDIGMVSVDAIIVTHNLNGLEVQIDDESIGYIPLGQLSSQIELSEILYQLYKDGTIINCIKIDNKNNVYSIKDLDIIKNEIKEFDDIEEEDIIRGYIRNLTNDHIEIVLSVKDNINKNNTIILPFIYNNKFYNYYSYATIFVKIVSKDQDGTIDYSIDLLPIWSYDFNETINIFKTYLDEYYKCINFLNLTHKIGDVVLGKILEINDDLVKVQLEDKSYGYMENYKNANLSINNTITSIIISININNLSYNLIEKNKYIKKNIKTELESIVECEIISIQNNFVIGQFKNEKGSLIYLPKHVHYNDFNCVMSKYFKLNKILSISYVEQYNNIIGIGLPTDYYNITADDKKRQYNVDSDESDNITVTIQPQTKKKKKKSRHDILEHDDQDEVSNIELPTVSNFWNLNLKSIESTKSKNTPNSDDDDDGKKIHKKTKKLTQAERREAINNEEKRVREIEENLAKPDRELESAEEFDRLLLSSPNDSSLWIQYMAFHLQSTEIDKARFVAKQGIKTISFREENERLNVWMALLNLELRYGNNESFNDILHESLKVNDQFTVYNRCLDILLSCNKIDELNYVLETMKKKFKLNSEMWINVASIYFQMKENDKAIKLLYRALTSLPDKDHVQTIVKFSQLMNKYNESEKAYTHIEQILMSYPKRIDIWSMYVDMLIKSEQIIAARQTLERAVAQKLNIKKMKTLFKKYLDFEKQYGTIENVNKVKQLAEEYIARQINNKE